MSTNLLTTGRVSGKLAVPNTMSGGQQTPFLFPPRKRRSTRKSIAESSAYHALPEVYPAGAWLYWQGSTSGICEDPAASHWAGERCSLPLFLLPKQ